MILDSGVCTVFRRQDISLAGGKPRYQYVRIYQSWYGELDFETRPMFQTEGRKELHTDARIRVYQNRGLKELDVVALADVHSVDDVPDGEPLYSIIRCWHGADDTSPDPYTDISLEVTRP